MKKINKINKSLLISILIATSTFGAVGVVNAATATVDLGTASSFAVLAGSGITNIPTSVITGNVGLSPTTGALITGLTQAEVTGTIYTVDAAGPGGYVQNPGLLTTAKNSLTAAYTDASGRTPATTLSGGDNQLGGQTLVPGVYSFGHASTANLTAASPLTLNGDGIYIFQASSDLVTASGSSVVLTGGAQACNVFWTVPSSASLLGSNSSFVGTIMAYSSLNLKTGASLQGRVLAETAAVTLDHNTITIPTTCTTPTGGSGSTTPTFPNTGFTNGLNTAILSAIAITSGIMIIAVASLIVLKKKRAL